MAAVEEESSSAQTAMVAAKKSHGNPNPGEMCTDDLTAPQNVDAEELWVLRGWCTAELTPWKMRGLNRRAIEIKLLEYNLSRLSIFVFRLHRGCVFIYDKRGVMLAPELHGILIRRAHMYRDLLSTAYKLCPNLDVILAIDLSDEGFESWDVPIFGFQKNQKSNSILLPDVDFISSNFYEDDQFEDNKDYYEKKDSAIFVGSTTGYAKNGIPYIRLEDVYEGKINRIRAAIYFIDNEYVTFLLPNIVQCSLEAEALIRSKGLGVGECDWRVQFNNRFILSMDGNGATCSRVAIALRSNSILVKYQSNRILHYFRSLTPWVHYIPVREDAEVERIIKIERDDPGYFESVAREGSTFARKYLNRSAIVLYVSELLRMYSDVFAVGSDDADPSCAHPGPDSGNGAAEEGVSLQIGVHLQVLGDVWFDGTAPAGHLGSNFAIEGFVLACEGKISHQEIEYRALLNEEILSEWVVGGNFCGTRGEVMPLRGFAVRLLGRAAENYSCVYTAFFIDGSRVGPMRDGQICFSEGLSPLQTIEISILPVLHGDLIQN